MNLFIWIQLKLPPNIWREREIGSHEGQLKLTLKTTWKGGGLEAIGNMRSQDTLPVLSEKIIN